MRVNYIQMDTVVVNILPLKFSIRVLKLNVKSNVQNEVNLLLKNHYKKELVIR